MRQNSRREFLLAASGLATAAATLAAKSRIDRSHISGISDEVPATAEEAIVFAKQAMLKIVGGAPS